MNTSDEVLPFVAFFRPSRFNIFFEGTGAREEYQFFFVIKLDV